VWQPVALTTVLQGGLAGPSQGTHSTFVDLNPIHPSIVKVLKLEKLLPSAAKLGKRIVINDDGTLSSKHSVTKIDSVSRLSIALLALGRVMPLKDPAFSLVEFTSYMARIIGLCNTYSLESVVYFEFEFRK
jgi:hypothetical protein